MSAHLISLDTEQLAAVTGGVAAKPTASLKPTLAPLKPGLAKPKPTPFKPAPTKPTPFANDVVYYDDWGAYIPDR